MRRFMSRYRLNMLTVSETKRNKLGDFQNIVNEVWAVVGICEEYK